MSDHARLSIWETDPALDSWYNAAVDSKACLCNICESAMEEMLFFNIPKSNQVKYGCSATDGWFYGATMGESMTIGETASEISPSASTSSQDLASPRIEARTLPHNKPLPPVPISPPSFTLDGDVPPYFDYLFANASLDSGIGRGKSSPDNVSFEIDNDAVRQEMPGDDDGDHMEATSSPHDSMPLTPEHRHDTVTFGNLDGTGFTGHSFVRGGILVPIKGNYGSTANTSSHFSVHPADEIQKDTASGDFFGGFAVEQSTSLYLTPITDHSSGQSERRNGSPTLLRQVQAKERQAWHYTVEEADAVFQNYSVENARESARPACVPQTHKSASGDSEDGCRRFLMVIELTSNDSSTHESDSAGKKRKADDPLTTNSCSESSSRDGYEVRFFYKKKARVTSKSVYDTKVDMAHNEPPHSLMTIPDADPERMSNKSDTASAIFAKIAPAPLGYPGQFLGVMRLEHAVSNIPLSGSSLSNNKRTTMNDPQHPKYLFTQTNVYPHPNEHKLAYRMRIASRDSPAFRSIDYAEEFSEKAADTPRTAVEEALRRQTHGESALACLEGICVGEYRYYQGHLNIEEYVEAGMCVCWEVCGCAKMCTRFPDMLCPCSEYIKATSHFIGRGTTLPDEKRNQDCTESDEWSYDGRHKGDGV